MHKVILGLILSFFALPALAVNCGPAAGIVGDLSSAGAEVTINGAIFRQTDPQPTGTGVIDPFLRIQRNGCEEGFNTSGTPLPDVKTGIWTHDLLTSSLTTTVLNGVSYVQFLLDINQTGSHPLLSLEEFRLYSSPNASVEDPSQLGNLLYDLDAGVNRYLLMDFSLNSGSGSGDVFAFIPSLLFAGADPYIYMWNRFGDNNGSNDGFEEWAHVINQSSSSGSSGGGSSGGGGEVPEPGTLGLLGAGIMGLMFARKREKDKKDV